VAGSFEDDNEISNSINHGEFIDLCERLVSSQE
jgi:hypothetical protein